MKLLILILCATTFAYSSKSQNKQTIQIINSKTKQGIPFATVKSMHTKSSLSADKNGFTEIQILENDSIAVSSIGYADLLLPVTEMKINKVIELQEQYEFMEDVIIGKSINFDIKYNDFKPNFSFTPNPENPWCIATEIKLPANLNKIRLNSIKIRIYKSGSKNINPIRLHLYKADKNGLFLEEELLKKDMVLPEIEINKKYLEFRLEDHNVILNRNKDSIFYVGLEFLSFSPKKIFDGPGIKITTRSKEQNTVFRNFIIGKPELKSKWVYFSDEDINISKSTKAAHPWNMIVTISTSVIN